jgi:hypothetical protein
MLKVWINATAGLLALLLAATAGGQPPSQPKSSPPPREGESKPPAKSKLEEWLAQALQNNADIRVAVAKANEAEAELYRTRLQVMQKVVQAYHAVEVAQANVTRWQSEVRRLKGLVEAAAVDAQVLIESENQLAAAKAQLAAAEAELPFLVGKGPMESPAVQAGIRWLQRQDSERTKSKPALGPMTDKIRKALDRPITITARQEPLSGVLDTIAKESGLTIQVQPGCGLGETVTVKLENLPLGTALQWLEDAAPGCRVLVRDYGLLLAPPGGSLPRGALLLNDFWKADAEGATRVEGKNPPPENVEGVVKSVDPSGGLVTITIGSAAGLRKGHTLEVFHLDKDPKQSKYLGTLRIVEVTATQAVGQPVGRTAAPLQTGDRVRSKIGEQ